jgi:formyltetrahydrofolate hydrolase
MCVLKDARLLLNVVVGFRSENYDGRLNSHDATRESRIYVLVGKLEHCQIDSLTALLYRVCQIESKSMS